MQNEAQYNLDRKAAKISTLSSNNLDKYEYLTGENLGLLKIYYTLYNYLNYFFKSSAKEISIKNKSFLKDPSKGFKLKSVYTTKGENNVEKAYDNLVFNDKKIDDVLYKKADNELINRNKNMFQEAKKLFDLRVEIYKKWSLNKKI